jgi:hypothetical protein
VFTNEFIESLKPAGNPFERAYIAQLAKDPKAAGLRDRIEALLAKYPEDKRDVMITQIRSVSDIECRSNLAELYVYGNLIEHFKVVQVEPPLSFLGIFVAGNNPRAHDRQALSPGGICAAAGMNRARRERSISRRLRG